MRDGLPPLRDIIRSFGLSARKSLGQNFLLDPNLNRRIASAAGVLAETIVMETGPGPGGLTRALLEGGAAHVFAIERDRRFYPPLRQLGEHFRGRLSLIEDDALNIDPATLQKSEKKLSLMGNLPFNIATPLLAHWLMGATWPPCFENICVLVQKEVAERITAAHGGRAYGRLSVLCQWRTRAKILFSVSKTAFTPRPQVDAALIQIAPAAAPDILPQSIEDVTRLAFRHRRKMLRASFDPALIEQAGLDPTMRAEQISIAGFCVLAKLYQDSL